MIVPIGVFILTYVLMIMLPNHRYLVALASAGYYLIAGVLQPADVLTAVDWNILLMLLGMMGTVSFFIETGMPDRMAQMLFSKAHNAKWAVILLSLFAGVISAFMDNVATVLMIAPVGLAAAKELKISPVAMLISIAVSSNLQGAATLVGDTTSIMLGGYANMDFLDFFFMQGRPGIFWAVEFGALATVPVIMLLFRDGTQAVNVKAKAEVSDYVPTWLLLLNMGLLICASFLPQKPAMTNGLICFAIFIACMIHSVLRRRDLKSVASAWKEMDVQTLLLLAALFVVIDAVRQIGLLDILAQTLISVGKGNLFVIYSLIVWGSVLCSAFIDNIPFVATMLPVVSSLAAGMGCSPYVLYFGLLTGATLGGNLSPFGASANIAAIGILRREGHEVHNRDFFRIGVPFTLTAVTVGYLYCWFVWAGA